MSAAEAIAAATTAMRAFNLTLSEAIASSVRSLSPEGRTVASWEWEEPYTYREGGTTFRTSLTRLVVTLDDGSTIEGIGPARLEAIVDAQQRAAEK